MGEMEILFFLLTLKKKIGNMAIKEDDYDGAIVRYKQALANFSQIREELTEEEEKQATLIKLGCYLNMALCYLKSPGREAKVIQNCEEALALDGENVKVCCCCVMIFFLFYYCQMFFF